MLLAHGDGLQDDGKSARHLQAHHASNDHNHHRGIPAAQNEMETRVVERAGLGAADILLESCVARAAERLEAVVEKAAERVVENRLQTSVERGLERGMEHGCERAMDTSFPTKNVFERILGDGAEEAGERIVEHGISAGLTQGVKRGVNKSIQQANMKMATGSQQQQVVRKFPWSLFRRKQPAVPQFVSVAQPVASRTLTLQVMRILRVLVPVAGTLFVAYLACDDFKRARREWKQHRMLAAKLLFILATICDGTDAVLHAVAVLGLTVMTIDSNVLQRSQTFGLKCAIIAMTSMVVGELVSAGVISRSLLDRSCRRRNASVKQSAKASDIHMVAVHQQP